MKLQTMDSSILSFIILVLVYVNVSRREGRVFVQYQLFIALLQSNMAMIVIDILGWIFNGLPGQLSWLCNTGFNLLLYIAAPASTLFWILYVDFQVYHDERRLQIVKRAVLAVLLVNAVLAAVSLSTGWYFYVDDNNIYHRGDYFWVHLVFSYSLIAYSFFFLTGRRKLIEKRYYNSLLLFFVPQSIGTLLQTFNYGVSYNWSGMMLSLLIIYFNLQEQGLNTDYLTGVYNRRQLDSYIKFKIKNSTAHKSFSAILIDLNGFKQINDRFGHDAGDEALQTLVSIIKRCIFRNDLIARFGGDEFFVIMDNDDPELLAVTARHIKEQVSRFNSSGQKAYQLGVSIGYDVYNHKIRQTPREFIKHIDALMYEDKQQSRSRCLP